MIDVVLALLLPRYESEIAHPDPSRSLRFATHAFFAVMDSYAIRVALDDVGWGENDDLVEELHRMFMGYLERKP